MAEKSNPKVSVIVPSYNSLEYIHRCLDSILGQSLNDIELISVDAGSTDGSAEVLKEYAAKDSRIRLLHSDKKSYGFQINMGFQEARGAYLGIVETDDYIDNRMYESLYATAVKNDLDFIKSDYQSFLEWRGTEVALPERLFEKGSEFYNQVIPANEYPSLYYKGEYVWNGIYKRDLIVQNHITLNESPKAAYQDKGLFVKTLFYARKIMFTEESFYRYRRDHGDSSVYNENAFEYVAGEFEYIFKFLEEQGPKAQPVFPIYYRKLLLYLFNTQQIIYRPFYLEAIDRCYERFRKIFQEGYQKQRFTKLDFRMDDWWKYQLFMNSKEKCLSYLEQNTSITSQYYIDYLEKLKDQSFFLFGAGNIGKYLCCFFETNGLGRHILGICDNDSQLWGNEIQGHKIIPPAEALQNHPDACYIVANRKYNQNIQQQLYRSGLSHKQIGVFDLPMHPILAVSKLGRK